MPIVKQYDVPMTRDPFVNTPLIPAGMDPDTGEERFLISTWNANVGCLSALVTPSGKERIYRFKKGEGICGCGAYSAVLTDNDTMWLCSDLSYLVRLTLSTGDYSYHPTGARSGLVFSGMQYDDATGKLLFMANAYPCLCAVSYDTRTLSTVHIYENFTKATLGNGGFPNGDGTYTLRLTTERSSLYQWDPKAESLTFICDINESAQCSRVIFDDKHQAYIPMEGWMAPEGTFTQEPRPKEEKYLWFGRTETRAFGAEECSEGVNVYSWEFTTGDVSHICFIPDGTNYGLALTKEGEIVSVSVFGVFSKFNSNGVLKVKKTLQADSKGHIDCLKSMDDTHILGTPFISQRFWVLDMQSGKGIDAGRAATKAGEVLRVWNKAGNMYMASYTEGMLTEYDPNKSLCFSENPRIVAQAPNGMRPVADAEDENCLYYASNHHYGILGCVLASYNTLTGQAVYKDEPIEYQHIISLQYHKAGDYLLGTSTFRSDCDVTEIKEDTCYLLIIEKDTLTVREKIALQQGTNYAFLIGSVDDNTYLLLQIDEKNQHSLYLYHADKKEITPLQMTYQDCRIKQLKSLTIPNQFVALTETDVSIWELCNNQLTKTKTLLEDSNVYSVFGEKNRVLAPTEEKVYVIEL